MSKIGTVFNASGEIREAQEMMEIAAIHLADDRPDLAAKRIGDAAKLFKSVAGSLKEVATQLAARS